jgi:predicted CxxxxCH...CXXCH cytochrome family protein
MNKKFYIVFSLTIIAFISAVILISGCNKQNDNLVTAPGAGYHPSGWLNPTNSNFHGMAIASANWSMSACKPCHGNDYKGGNTQVSCMNCHTNGPENCNVCHGDALHIYPPKSLFGNTEATQQGVGAHVTHLSSDSTVRYSAQVSCTECHLQVNSFADTNHIKPNANSVAGVVFGTLARKTTPGVTPNPVWNRTTQTCSSVYCHGYFKNGNLTAQPIFNIPGSVVCGSCHGNPTTGDPTPGGHINFPTQCYYCHNSVVDSNRVIINKYLHVNGVINFNDHK